MIDNQPHTRAEARVKVAVGNLESAEAAAFGAAWSVDARAGLDADQKFAEAKGQLADAYKAFLCDFGPQRRAAVVKAWVAKVAPQIAVRSGVTHDRGSSQRVRQRAAEYTEVRDMTKGARQSEDDNERFRANEALDDAYRALVSDYVDYIKGRERSDFEDVVRVVKEACPRL